VSTEFCNYGYMINLQVDSINVCLDEYDMFRTLLLEAKLNMQLFISVHTIVSRIWLFLITQSFSLAAIL
jgi:hypothetical protein